MKVSAEATGTITQCHQVEAEVADDATPEQIKEALEHAAEQLFNEDLCQLEGSDFTVTLDEIEKEDEEEDQIYTSKEAQASIETAIDQINGELITEQ